MHPIRDRSGAVTFLDLTGIQITETKECPSCASRKLTTTALVGIHRRVKP